MTSLPPAVAISGLPPPPPWVIAETSFTIFPAWSPLGIKDFDTVAASNPSLVTNQDAWIYGQCIKAQAIKAINSDDNEYIKIVREDNKTKIKFEPWVEVHTVTELADIDKI